MFDDMPKGSPNCWPHKRAVESLSNQLLKALKSSPSDTDASQAFKDFKDMRLKPPKPPSDWSRLILDYEQKSPSLGPGCVREGYDFVTNIQEIKNTTRVTKGCRALKVHKARWLKYAMDTLEMSQVDAIAQWDEADRTLKGEARDEAGPAHSKLRLAMPFDEYIDLENEVEHTKILRMEGGRKKIKSIADLEAQQATLRDGHVGFTDETFVSVGGELAEHLARTGSSASVSSTGKGVFGGQKKSFIDGLNVKETTKKKHKRYEVEIHRTELADTIREQALAVVIESKAAYQVASNALDVSSACEEMVAGLPRWRQILLSRLEYLEVMALGSDAADNTKEVDWDGPEDEELEQIEFLKQQIALAMNATALQSEVRKTFLRVMAEIESNRTPTRAYPILLKHSWSGTEFQFEVNYKDFLGDVSSYEVVRIAELHLKRLVDAKISCATVHPVGDIQLLVPLVGLDFTKYEVETSMTEHDLKTLKKKFEVAKEQVYELIHGVKNGASTVTGFIDKQNKKEEKKVADEAEVQAKEKEKADKIAKKAMEGAAALKGDKKKTSKHVPVSLPSAALTHQSTSSEDVSGFTEFATFEAFNEWRLGKTLADFRDMGPYTILQVSANISQHDFWDQCFQHLFSQVPTALTFLNKKGHHFPNIDLKWHPL
jgi:hypothetical protein